MELVKEVEDIVNLKQNQILGETPVLMNTTIKFEGKNNLLFCEKGVRLQNSSLSFKGNNSVIFLGTNRHVYHIAADIYYNCVLGIGRNNYFNGTLRMSLSEEKHVLIGDECLLSLGVWIRTADPHLIYSSKDKQRINPSKSVFVGDHVWIGQDAMLLKGSCIGSGSIIAAKALLGTNKGIPSNTTWGGNPIKELKKDIFWEGSCVHAWTKESAKQYEKYESDRFIYEYCEEEKLSWKKIEETIDALPDSQKRLEYVKTILENPVKNRFFIEHPSESKKKKFWKKC